MNTVSDRTITADNSCYSNIIMLYILHIYIYITTQQIFI